MRIAFLPSADLSYESGSIINAIILISGLESLGHDINTLAQKPPTSHRLNQKKISINPYLLEHPIITDRYISDHQHDENLIIYLEYLFSLHSTAKLDVILVQYFSVASYAAKIFSEITGIPYVVFCFGRDLSSFNELSASLKNMLYASMQTCDGVIFPNDELLKEFRSAISRPTPPHLISPPALTPEIFDLDFHAFINIPQKIKIITTINSCFKPEKGIETIISAFSKVREQRSDVFLLIAGTDDHPEELNRKRLIECISSYNLLDFVIFTGYLNRHQIGGLLDKTDLFVDARGVSNFSSVLIEAQAFKVPSISAKNTSSLKIIEDHINGLLFEAGDSNQLSMLCLKSLADEDFSSSLRAGCSAWCKKKLVNFTSENTTIDIHDFIKGVTKDGR